MIIMEFSAYYYNNYDFSTSFPTYDFYTFVDNGQSGTYEALSNSYEVPTNLYEEQVNPIEMENDSVPDPNSIPLPKELTNMFKPLECELCGVSVICHTSAFTHYEGKTHIKNVSAYMKEHYNVFGSLKIKKERFTPVRCDTCNIELTSKIVYQQHVSGKQHIKNLKKKQYSVPTAPAYDLTNENDLLPPPPPTKLNDYVCEICGISTNTELQMNFHKNGQKHQRKLAKLNEYKLDNALNCFYNVEWPEGSETANFFEGNGSVSFIENPEMDCPLQYNDFAESYNETNIDDTEMESENLDKTESFKEIIPSSLEEKTREIPADLGIEDEKLISSTGVFLRQLNLITQPINSKESGREDNASSKCKVSNGTSSINLESAQNSTENFKSDIKENVTSIESSSVNNFINESELELLKVTCLKQTVETKLGETSSNSKEGTSGLNETKTNNESNKDSSQEINLISENLKVPLNNMEIVICGNESTKSLEKAIKNKQDSKLDQVLTKLAMEEIEKESINYGKIRDSKNNSPEDINGSCAEGEVSISIYKYDKAGYRIKEEFRRNQNPNKGDGYDSSRKRQDNNINNYFFSKDCYGKKRNNYNWNVHDNYNHNYKMINNYNYSHSNIGDRTNDHWKYYNRNNDKYRKLKRDEKCGREVRRRDHRYDNDEVRRRDHRIDGDKERKRDHRFDRDEEHKRNQKYDIDTGKIGHRYNNDGQKGDRHSNDEGRSYASRKNH